jgi:hypothetical protein
MLVEPRDDLLRVPAEPVVAVLEAARGAVDPEQLLLVAGEQVEGLLSRPAIARSRVVVEHLIMNTGIFTLAIARAYLRVRAKWSYPLAQLPFAGRAELAVRINGHPVCRRQASP